VRGRSSRSIVARHVIICFNTRNEGLELVSMVWRAKSGRPYQGPAHAAPIFLPSSAHLTPRAAYCLVASASVMVPAVTSAAILAYPSPQTASREGQVDEGAASS